ncbi:MAG: 5'-3' exonuclease H3TH domain-containing protein [Candidatus Wallbacteria bacterium]
MEKFDNKKTIYLIDTYNLIFRAHFSFAARPLMTTYNMHISAVYGFLNMLHKILNDYEPVYIACVHDTGEKTFRDEIYPEYKAHRPECPAELIPQFQVVFDFIDALGIKRLSQPGLEADDVIGTLCQKASENGFFVKIISSDRDLFQLISDKVRMICLKKGITEIVEYDEKELKNDLGIGPDQVVDYKALVGDPSDNIPGIHGIGPKSAVELLAKYKNLDGIFEVLPKIGGKREELLRTGRDMAYLSQKLAKIKCDADINCELESLAEMNVNSETLGALCEKYEQRKMLEKYRKYFDKRSDFFYGNI